MTTDEETRTAALELGRGLDGQPSHAAAEDSSPRPAPQAEGPAPVASADRQREVDDAEAPLLAEDRIEELRSQWQDIQADFVDDPRSAVERSDALVAEVMQTLAETFARERTGLEQDWSGGGEPSTENLRIAVQRYRSFFHRLLSL